MSKLTEIMKQIPLDELTGDDNMTTNTIINSNETENAGAGKPVLVRRSAGAIISVAACAALIAGGVFAYSKFSKPKTDEPNALASAESITGTDSTVDTENEFYKANLQAYRDWFEKSGIDYSREAAFISPLMTESTVGSVGDIEYRMIGCRSVGAFIRVDMEINCKNGDFFIDPKSCGDIKLKTADGGTISGNCVELSTLSDGKGRLFVSFAFPQYVITETGEAYAVNDNTDVTFSVGKLFFQQAQDAGDYLTGSYENRFTFGTSKCYDHTVPCNVDVNVMPLVPYMSHTDKLHIKEVNYCDVGATIVFSIEGVDDEYKQKALDSLQEDLSISGIERLAKAVMLNGDEKYITSMYNPDTNTAVTIPEYSIMVDKNDDNWELLISREFFDSPMDADQIEKFIFGASELNGRVEVKVVDLEAGMNDSETDAELPTFEDIGLEFLETQQRGQYREGDTLMVYFTADNLPSGHNIDTIDLADTAVFTYENASTVVKASQTALMQDESLVNKILLGAEVKLTDLGVTEGGKVKIDVEDLVNSSGEVVAEGHYSRTIEVSAVGESLNNENEPSYKETEYFTQAENLRYYRALREEYPGSDVMNGAYIQDRELSCTFSGFEGLDMRVVGQHNSQPFTVVDVKVSTTDGSPIADKLGKGLIRTDYTNISLFEQGVEMSESVNSTLLWDIIGDEEQATEAVLGIPIRTDTSDKTVWIVITKLVNEAGETVAEGSFTADVELVPQMPGDRSITPETQLNGTWSAGDPDKAVRYEVVNVTYSAFGAKAKLRLLDADKYRNTDGTLRTADLILDFAQKSGELNFFAAKYGDQEQNLSADTHVTVDDEEQGIIDVNLLCSTNSADGLPPVMLTEKLTGFRVGSVEVPVNK